MRPGRSHLPGKRGLSGRSPVFMFGAVSAKERSLSELLLAPRRPCPPRRRRGVGGQGEVPQAASCLSGCLWSGLPPCHRSSGPRRWTPGGPARGTPPRRGLPPLLPASPTSWLLQTPGAPSPREPRPGLEERRSPRLFCGNSVPRDNPSFSSSFQIFPSVWEDDSKDNIGSSGCFIYFHYHPGWGSVETLLSWRLLLPVGWEWGRRELAVGFRQSQI